MGKERRKSPNLMQDCVLSLTPCADHLRLYCRACHARCLTRMVSMACRLLLLSGKGVHEIANLVREDSGCRDGCFLRDFPVRYLQEQDPSSNCLIWR